MGAEGVEPLVSGGVKDDMDVILKESMLKSRINSLNLRNRMIPIRILDRYTSHQLWRDT